jgi:L-alanine-DL-glutamate epimerase-like enolase superfamily enzyme
MAPGLPTDIQVLEAQAYFQAAEPRGGFKFGNVVAGDLTLCHVRVRVANRRGAVADGWGAIFLSHYWAYPDPAVTPATKDALMRQVVGAICARVSEYRDFAHPLAIFLELEPELATLGNPTGATSLPPLATLVCASPVDAALHDAFGRVNGIASYAGYGREHCRHVLSAALGHAFAGRYAADYLRPQPMPTVPIAHTVGGLDRLRPDEPGESFDDDLPDTLAGWIARDGLYCFKVKLRGRDLPWDLERLIAIHAVATGPTRPPAAGPVQLSVDFNGQCASPDYAVELLLRLRELSPATYASLRYVEQPMPPDTLARGDDLRALAVLKPVVVDESLTSIAALDRALALGWTGIALKTCKCHSLDLLLAARAEESGLLYMVQDLSNPGIALLHSIGLAAHLRPRLAVEANARQYYPVESAPEALAHPAIVQIRDGVAQTASLRGPGLGYQLEKSSRPLFHQGAAN